MFNNLKNKAYFFVDRIERLYFSKKDIAEGYFLYGEKKAYFTDARYFSDAVRCFKNTYSCTRLFTYFFNFVTKLHIFSLFFIF